MNEQGDAPAPADLGELGPSFLAPTDDADLERGAIQGELTGPSYSDPLRGLTRLARVALLGRRRILDRAREPVVYAWQDIAVAGTIILLAGGPSGGKTTLLFLLLVARMNPGQAVEILGRLVTPAPRGQWIVLIEAEHAEASTCRKLERTCALAGVDDAALERVLIIARKAVRIGSPEWVEIEKLVAAGLVSDIACDTLARVAPADANDEREQAAIFEIIAQTIEAAPPGLAPTVWIAAHTRKGDGASGDDVAGSAQRVGQADSMILVKGEKVGGQTVSSTVTFWKLREEPDDYPAPVTFAIVKGADGERSIRVTGPGAADNRPLEGRIEDLLGGGPKTKGTLKTALKRSDGDIEDAISVLFAAKRIQATTISVGGRSRKAFALRTFAPAGKPAFVPPPHD